MNPVVRNGLIVLFVGYAMNRLGSALSPAVVAGRSLMLELFLAGWMLVSLAVMLTGVVVIVRGATNNNRAPH